MSLSLAMLIWARKRAGRAAISHSERAFRLSRARAVEQREHEATLRALRIR